METFPLFTTKYNIRFPTCKGVYPLFLHKNNTLEGNYNGNRHTRPLQRSLAYAILPYENVVEDESVFTKIIY